MDVIPGGRAGSRLRRWAVAAAGVVFAWALAVLGASVWSVGGRPTGSTGELVAQLGLFLEFPSVLVLTVTGFATCMAAARAGDTVQVMREQTELLAESREAEVRSQRAAEARRLAAELSGDSAELLRAATALVALSSWRAWFAFGNGARLREFREAATALGAAGATTAAIRLLGDQPLASAADDHLRLLEDAFESATRDHRLPIVLCEQIGAAARSLHDAAAHVGAEPVDGIVAGGADRHAVTTKDEARTRHERPVRWRYRSGRLMPTKGA